MRKLDLSLLVASCALALGACATTSESASASNPTGNPTSTPLPSERASDAARAVGTSTSGTNAIGVDTDAKSANTNGSRSVLYARDGSVVSAEPATATRFDPQQGSAAPMRDESLLRLEAKPRNEVVPRVETGPRIGAEPARELGDHSGTRVYMLDLYQKAMEDKAALALKVDALQAELEHSRAACNDGDKVREGLRSQMDALMKERDQLRTESLDLAARLTTTQLRRLEAEKKLLEIQIEAQRREDAEAVPRESPKTPSKNKKTPGDKP